jgi:NitT/TauT family transport system permease protein
VAGFLGVVVALVALWEGYRALALALGPDAPLPVPVRGSGNAATFPHTWEILAALGRPYRGGQTLGTFLAAQAGYTLREVAAGFVLGTLLGFALGTLFAHSRLAERSLMPYVVASQTVPFLAFAPILVVATGSVDALPSWSGVALLATYLVFFPMTVSTLRGLRSAPATAEELLRSYGASSWTRLWRLRVPAAVPHLFAGAKVGATAAVVGAIVGELSAPGAEGIGAALFSFGRVSNNALQLFATTLVAGLLGIGSYAVVALAERVVVRRFAGAAPR